MEFQVRALAKNTVRIKRTIDLTAKLQRMISDGPKKLQIITDFDHTLSKSHCNDGSAGLITHAIFQKELQKLTEINNKYFPIYHDGKLTDEQKSPLMINWWNESHHEIVSAGYNRERLDNFVTEANNLQLRDGVIEFFKIAEEAGIPVIIFSAGIGDIIEIMLKHKLGSVPKNVHIIGNFMIFDAKDVVVDFSSPIVHSFNKNSSVINGDRTFMAQLHDRTNVLLMGDVIGDLKMDVGLECEQNVIKIGFLNHSVETLLPLYQDGFDVVCVKDQTFDIPTGVINAISSRT